MSRNFPIKSYEEWEKYTDLVGRVKRGELDPENILTQTSQKRKLLKNVFGYEVLKGPGGPIIIERCSDSRIGQAFRNDYNSIVKKLREQRLLEAMTSDVEESCDMMIGNRNYPVEVRA